MTISLTQSAADRISGQIANNASAVGLRFTAKESGCSGYSYVMDLAESIEEDEVVLESRGIKIITNAPSLDVLQGTQIDYVQEGLNQTFKFSNPKAEAHCGCGESFAISA
ncbi:MAG: HesB/IscA family protein [Arenicella sp.]